MQIQHNAAAFSFLMEPVLIPPLGIPADSLHYDGFQLSISLFFINIFQITVLSEGTDHLAHHNPRSGFLLYLQKPAAVLPGKAHRLFQKDIHPLLHCRNRMLGMKIAGQTDMNRIQFFLP